MLYELARTIVQKILQDKILLGLVIVAVLGIFVGGVTIGGDDKPRQAKAPTNKQAAQQAPQQAAQPVVPTMTPPIAADFVGWWLGSAMDYNAATCQQRHQEAFAWMSREAAQAFQAYYWTPQIAEAVATGRLVAAFHPTGIQPQAVNPDGSVVVGVSGTMIIQSGGQPVSQQVLASFLVKQEPDGMRIAGINARTGVLPGSSIY